ncbi:MAG TPA: peroxiredoxin [Polyangiaceae bacterium]|jgi:peroxiredoxin Q/BCP
MISRLVVGCSLLLLAACQKASTPDAAGHSSAAPAASAAAEPALLAEGAQLPDVSAVEQDGSVVRLRDFLGKPVVVYFYPKDDTTGCTIEAKGIRDLYTDLKATSAVVIGVSSDDRDSHVAFTSKYQLPFVLLDDSAHKVENAFGVPLSAGHAQRVTFVFDGAGKLRKVFPHVNPTGHAAEILNTLKALG